jgi:hypothetical protein
MDIILVSVGDDQIQIYERKINENLIENEVIT